MNKSLPNFKGNKNPNFKTGACLTTKKRPSWYASWQNMKQRCFNKSHPKYKNYGKRGIKVCEEWLSIFGFKKWVEKSAWKEPLSIDRININGNYSPKNCRWISCAENSRIKTTSKLTFSQAQKIRKLHATGNYSASTLADKFRVSDSIIFRIVHYKIHKTCPVA